MAESLCTNSKEPWCTSFHTFDTEGRTGVEVYHTDLGLHTTASSDPCTDEPKHEGSVPGNRESGGAHSFGEVKDYYSDVHTCYDGEETVYPGGTHSFVEEGMGSSSVDTVPEYPLSNAVNLPAFDCTAESDGDTDGIPLTKGDLVKFPSNGESVPDLAIPPTLETLVTPCPDNELA